MKTIKHLSDQRGRIAELIRTWPQAAQLPDSEIETVASLVREVTVPAQWALMSQGTPGDATYLLVSGRVRVVRDGVVLDRLGPGSVLGEMAVATGQLRSATVVSDEPCELLHLSADAFDRMRLSCPRATTSWTSYVTERVRRLASLPAPRTATGISRNRQLA